MTYPSGPSRSSHPDAVHNHLSTPAAPDGAQVGKAGAFSKNSHVGIEHAIRSSSPATLLSSTKNVAIPEYLTSAQKQVITNLLDKYHPRTLAHSPLIDACGVPIPLHLASKLLTASITGKSIPVDSPTSRGLVKMFTNYRQHLNWEPENRRSER